MNSITRAQLQELVEQAKEWLKGRLTPCSEFVRQSEHFDPYHNQFLCAVCGGSEEAHIIQAFAACLAAEKEFTEEDLRSGKLIEDE